MVSPKTMSPPGEKKPGLETMPLRLPPGAERPSLEVWLESRARPPERPEVVLGLRAPEDVTRLRLQIEVKGQHEVKKHLLDQSVPLVRGAPDNTLVTFPLPDDFKPKPGMHKIVLRRVTYVSAGRRIKYTTPAEGPERQAWIGRWQVLSPEREIFSNPFRVTPLEPDDDAVFIPIRYFKTELEVLLQDLGRRLIVVRGSVGSGKTTLLRRIPRCLREIGQERTPVFIPEDLPLHTPMTVARWMEEVGPQTVLLVDDLDHLPLEGKDDHPRPAAFLDELAEVLRATEGLIFVVVRKDVQPVSQAFRQTGWIWPLPSLSDKQARALIHKAPVVLDYSVEERLLALGDNNPLLLQLILENLTAETNRQGYATLGNLDLTTFKAIDSGRYQIQHFWRGLSAAAQRALIGLMLWEWRRGEGATVADIEQELSSASQSGRLTERLLPDVAYWGLAAGVDEAIALLQQRQKDFEKMRLELKGVRDNLQGLPIRPIAAQRLAELVKVIEQGMADFEHLENLLEKLERRMKRKRSRLERMEWRKAEQWLKRNSLPFERAALTWQRLMGESDLGWLSAGERFQQLAPAYGGALQNVQSDFERLEQRWRQEVEFTPQALLADLSREGIVQQDGPLYRLRAGLIGEYFRARIEGVKRAMLEV